MSRKKRIFLLKLQQILEIIMAHLLKILVLEEIIIFCLGYSNILVLKLLQISKFNYLAVI